MSDKKRPIIAFTKYSPYMVIDLEKMEDSKGNPLTLKPVTMLCRCGNSKSKPYCDGTHSLTGINGEKDPERDPYKWKDYRGEKIIVHYNLGVCSHDGTCIRELPAVFNVNKRPWITPDNADPDKIIGVIKKCPSGALSYTFAGEKHIDYYKGSPIIRLARKGPLELYGGIILKDDQGTTPETYDHYTLCRCGFSKNKPFCDGKHLRNRFSDV